MNGYEITHTVNISSENFQKAKQSKTFIDWQNRIEYNNTIKVNKIEIHDVDMFGPNVGFIKFNADVENLKGKKLPGIVFMRSPAVAVLVILIGPNGNRWVVGVRQPRVPVAISDYLEIPAGMMDNESNFVGVAAKELREEVGIDIKSNELIDLCSEVSKNTGSGPDIDIGPSVGGCNETIKLFLCVKHVTKEFVDSLNKKIIENNEHNTWETITVELIEYDSAWIKFKDVKALCALMYAEKLKLI